jgi:hypothetical protein
MTAVEKLKRLISGSRGGAQSVAEGIKELRERRLALLDLRDDVRARPVPYDEACAALRRDLAVMGADVIDGLALGGLMRPDGAPRFKPERPSPRLVNMGDGPPVVMPAPGPHPLALLAAAVPDALASAIEAKLAAAYQNAAEPMTEADKAAEMARIDGELSDLERAEEAAIRAAEAAGMSIMRRGDADPSAVLAPDAALP